MQSIEDKIVSRIYGRRRGWSFSPNDFAGDFSRTNIDKARNDSPYLYRREQFLFYGRQVMDKVTLLSIVPPDSFDPL